MAEQATSLPRARTAPGTTATATRVPAARPVTALLRRLSVALGAAEARAHGVDGLARPGTTRTPRR